MPEREKPAAESWRPLRCVQVEAWQCCGKGRALGGHVGQSTCSQNRVGSYGKLTSWQAELNAVAG